MDRMLKIENIIWLLFVSQENKRKMKEILNRHTHKKWVSFNEFQHSIWVNGVNICQQYGMHVCVCILPISRNLCVIRLVEIKSNIIVFHAQFQNNFNYIKIKTFYVHNILQITKWTNLKMKMKQKRGREQINSIKIKYDKKKTI